MTAQDSDNAMSKCIRYLRGIATFRGEWFGVLDLARLMNLPKSGTHRTLQILVDEHILEQHETTRKYRHVPVTRKNIHE